PVMSCRPLFSTLFPYTTLFRSFSIVLIAGSYVCYTHTGSDLLPAMDEGGFIIDYIMPAGSSLEETNRVITHVEAILRKTPEVERDRKSTRLNSSHVAISYAVFC